ncbi:MAG: hypothetical protein A3F13_04960 [Gammaproteobacteria bacterium RIFCSPHIGHO2_12_FULL_40_19]|nr:MAG: hypothetical protein A3F13_04960 [Gammaproteobacteria bacterium RIFCSPHIGHO2_12_FULL_40_19]
MKICLKKTFDMFRFTKFTIIGVISFIIGFVTFNLSYILTNQLIFSLTLSYLLSVINGFFWNRHWTFKDRRKHTFWNQALRFMIFYSLGYCINLIVYAFILSLIGGFQYGVNHQDHFYMIALDILQGNAQQYSLLIVNIAGFLATGVTIIWNYVTNFFWSFKKA